MKAKTAFILTIIVLSCGCVKHREYLAVYKRPGVDPAYLIIKGGSLKQCELIYTNIGYGVVGHYVIKQDTLLFYSQYEYDSNRISTSDSIPYTFIYDPKHDCLTHIRNDPFWGYHEEIYNRLK